MVLRDHVEEKIVYDCECVCLILEIYCKIILVGVDRKIKFNGAGITDTVVPLLQEALW